MFKKLIFLILALFFSSLVLAKSSFSEKLNLNGQTWSLGYSKVNADFALAEYVIKGESVNDWNQLFTYQKFTYLFPEQVTPVRFADEEVNQLRAKKYELTYNVLESSHQEAIMEFRIIKPEVEQQNELQRIVRNNQGQIIVLHYVIKKLDMGDKERKAWINTLKNFDYQSLE